MGLDFNSIKFLLWAKNLSVSFDRTLTLGHQGLSCSRGRMGRALKSFGFQATAAEVDRCYDRDTFTALYADQFLRLLGGKEVTSVDRSDFEGATLLHDLNEPFPEHLRGTFDLVIDGGTLEHIFDYPKALSHCLELLHVGGHFITITPATGQMGHGFFQFSPELFFRVFDSSRGFRLRKIVAFKCVKVDSPFYEVTDPALSLQRTASAGNEPLQLAVLAEKVAEVSGTLAPPQQSDYVAIWKASEKRRDQAGGKPTAASGFLGELRFRLNPYWPLWLRDFRDGLRHRASWFLAKLKSGLVNQRHFRRLSDREIFNERSSAAHHPTL